MRKSRIPSQFSILALVLFAFAIIRVVYFECTYKYKTNSGSGYGTITMVSKKDDYTVFTIKSDSIFKAYIYDKNDLDYGDYIYFEYTNKDVFNNTIFNTFNYKKYLKSKDIKHVVEIHKFKKIKANKFYKYRGLIYKKILSRKSSNYIMTFLCGDKSYIDMDAKMSYSGNGISHLLCISGFHVAFLFGYLKRFLDRFIKKERYSASILIIIGLIYLILSNFMIALFRSIVMFFMKDYRYIKKLKIRPLSVFLFTLSISLILWPNIIYDVAFYYTFILTFFLIISRYDGNNAYIVAIYAFIVSAPITIYTNYFINILGIICSLLSSFVVCYILYPLSFFAVIFNSADKLLYKVSKVFEIISLKINEIDIFKIVIPKISIYLLFLIYILYILYLIKPNKIYLFSYFLIVIYMIFNKYFDNSYYIYYVDVNQGDMSVIVSSNFKSVTVIDTGGSINNTYFKYTIRQFLHSIGVRKINYLILTHGDFDHMGEAINLVDHFNVEKVIFNCGFYNDLEKDLIKVLDRKKIPYYSCIKKLDINNNKLYFMQTKKYDSENDNSNVIYTEIDGYKFMFMGDASITAEKEIINRYNLSNIDVLKVGHHGSKTSSSKYFIDRLNPRTSIISVGKNNRYGHPNKEVLENLNNTKIYRTDKDGSIMFKIKDNKLKIKSCRP